MTDIVDTPDDASAIPTKDGDPIQPRRDLPTESARSVTTTSMETARISRRRTVQSTDIEHIQLIKDMGIMEHRLDVVEAAHVRFQEHLTTQDRVTAQQFTVVDAAITDLRQTLDSRLTTIDQKLDAFDRMASAYTADAEERQMSYQNMQSVDAQLRSVDVHRKEHMDRQDSDLAELRHLLEVQTAIEQKRQDALHEAERVEAAREEKRRQHIVMVAKQTEQQTRDLSAQIAAQNKQLGDTLARYFGPLGVAAFSYFLVGSSTAGQTRTLVLAGIVVVVIIYIIAMIIRRAVIARRLRALQQAARSEQSGDSSSPREREAL